MGRKPFVRLLTAAAIAVMLTCAGPVAHAQNNVTWTGTSSTSWSGASNWSTLAQPPSGAFLYFSGGASANTTSNNDLSGLSLSGLTFLASTFTSPLTLSGSALTLSATTTTGASFVRTSGSTVTVTRANHGLVTGQFVSSTSSVGGYNTIAQVTVVDANTFTYTGVSTGSLTTVTGTYTPATINNLNTNAGRNVTIGNNLSLSNAQVWASASSTNAITIVSGNLSGSGNLTIAGGAASTGTQLPNFRLTGNNSSYSGTINFSGNGSVLLGSTAAMTGGLIDASTGGQNLWLTGGSGTYTFGIDGVEPSGARVRFGTAAGIFLTGTNVSWDPGNGSNYFWSGTSSTVLRFGASDAPTTSAPYRLLLGNTNSSFVVSGTNKSIVVAQNGRVELLSALSGTDSTARTLNIGGGGGVLILRTPANPGGGTNNLNVTVSGTSSALEISNMNQLPGGNLSISGSTAGNVGVVVLNSMTFDRRYGTGTGQWQLTGTFGSGGFAARGGDSTISNSGTSAFDQDFTLGTALLNPNGTLYADKVVTIDQDTTLTAQRSWYPAMRTGIAIDTSGPNVVNRITGNLSGAGSVVIGQSGTAGILGVLALGGTNNNWTGAPSLGTGANIINAGTGGLIARSGYVQFEKPESLPKGATSGTSYIATYSAGGSDSDKTPVWAAGLQFKGSTSGTVYDLSDNYRFLLSNNVLNQIPTDRVAVGSVFGATGGKVTVQGSAILLNFSGTAETTGTNSLTHVVLQVASGAELTLGSPGSPVDFIPSWGASTVSTTPTTFQDASGLRYLAKTGPGTLALKNVRYTNLTTSSNTFEQFQEWRIGFSFNDGSSEFNAGAVRGRSMSAANADSSNSLKNSFVRLMGGVYEIDNSDKQSGTLAVNLGTAWQSGTTVLNFFNNAVANASYGGGFSAFGDNVVVTLNSGSALQFGSGANSGPTAGTAGFLRGPAGSIGPLMFGSQTADRVITLTNDLNFQGATQRILVSDNTAADGDYAVLSGTLSNGGFNKIGPGLLELSATNTMSGTVTVSSGTLRLRNNLALQNAILDTSGTGRVAMTAGQTSPTFGGIVGSGTLSQVFPGYDSFTAFGFNPATTGTVSVPVVANSAGLGVTKIGSGTLVLAGANTYTGTTTVAGGVLSLASANALGAGGNVVFTGGTLQFTGSNTLDLSTRVVGSTGAMAFDTNGQTVSFANPLAASNVGGLTKSGSGTLRVAGGNAFAGTTTVSGGTLQAGGSGTPFGAGTVDLGNTGGIQLDVNGQNVSVARLINGGTGGGVALNSGTLTIGATSLSGTYAGSFTGPGSVVKAGAGVFTYNPAVSTTVSLSINQGLVSIAPTSTTRLELGTIGRSTGAGVNFAGIGTGTVAATNSLSNGIIGPWALTGTGANLRYATISSDTLANYTAGTAVSGTVTATNLADTTGAINYDVSARTGTAAATFSGNTIRYTGASGTLNPGATSFAVNGLMNAGTGLWTIGSTVGSSGTIQSGTTRELVVATNTQGVTINSVIANSTSGSSALTFISQGGGLTLAAANMFTGDIYMSGSGSGLTLGSGSFHAATTGNVFLSPAATLAINNNGSQSIGTIVGLGSTLTKSGTGLLTMSSATSSFTGAVSINAGVVSVSSLGMAGSVSSLGTGSTINIGTSSTAATLRYTGGGDTTNRVVNLAGSTGGATLEANGSGAWVLSSPLTAGGNGAKTLTLTGTSTALNSIGVIPNADGSTVVSVTKTGAGTWQLTGASSYTGRLRVLDGTVVVASVIDGDNPSPFGASSSVSDVPVIGDPNPTSGTAALLTTGTVNREFFVAAGGGAQVVALGGSGPGVARFENQIRLGRSVTLQASTGGSVEFANTWVDEAGGLSPVVGFTVGSVGNNGTVVLKNFLPLSTTGVTVNRGMLRLDYQDDFGGPIWYETPVTLGDPVAAAGSGLVVNNINQSLSNLSFTGVGSTVSSMASGTLRLFNDGGTAAVNVVGSGTGHQISSNVALDQNSVFNVAASARLAVSGVIGTGSSGARTLTKTGLGTLELSGANTYSGDTIVSQGSLAVNGFLGSGGLSVLTAATLMGSGTIGGDATIYGTHSPGNSPDIQTFAGNLTYAGGTSQVIWELLANTAALGSRGTSYDGINVTGTLNFAGLTTLNLNFGGLGTGSVSWEDSFWDSTQTWLLYSVSGTTTGSSNFQLASNPGSWVDSTGQAFSASTRSTNTFSVVQSGNNIILQYVPEPAAVTLALIGIAASAYAAVRRRRS